MSQAIPPLADIGAASRRIAHGVLDAGESRLELLVVEVQEACERLLHTFIFALAAAVFGLLAGITATAAIVFVCAGVSALGALVALTVLYGGAGVYLFNRLGRMRGEWQAFAATLDQLRKDREWLENTLR
jgi:uncharacterized membrane protein YqjE